MSRIQLQTVKIHKMAMTQFDVSCCSFPIVILFEKIIRIYPYINTEVYTQYSFYIYIIYICWFTSTYIKKCIYANNLRKFQALRNIKHVVVNPYNAHVSRRCTFFIYIYIYFYTRKMLFLHIYKILYCTYTTVILPSYYWFIQLNTVQKICNCMCVQYFCYNYTKNTHSCLYMQNAYIRSNRIIYIYGCIRSFIYNL